MKIKIGQLKEPIREAIKFGPEHPPSAKIVSLPKSLPAEQLTHAKNGKLKVATIDNGWVTAVRDPDNLKAGSTGIVNARGSRLNDTLPMHSRATAQLYAFLTKGGDITSRELEYLTKVAKN